MNIDRLNINVGGVASPGFSGDAAELDRLAATAGGVLPDSYVAFLRAADGGHPEVGSFSVQEGEPDELFDVDWFFSVADPRVERVADALSQWSAVLGPGALPIGRDGGGNVIYLRLGPPDPPVWLYVHDARVREHKIADTFSAFIDGLHENPDFI